MPIGACWLYTDARGSLLGVGVAFPVVLWLAHRKMGTVKPLLAPLAALVASIAVAVGASAAFGNLSLSVPLLAIFAAYLVFVGALVLWLSWRETGAAVSDQSGGDGGDRGQRRRERSGRRLLVSLGVLAAVVALAVGGAAAFGKLPLPDLPDGGGGSAVAGDRGLTSLQLRAYIWRETIPLIMQRPLLGHGPDNFSRPFYTYTDKDSKAFQKVDGQVVGVDRAHNDLLQVAATTGLLGLGAYLWIFVAYFRNAYRRGGWPLIALSGAVLAYILQLQTVFPSLDTSVAFWGLLGASVAMMRIRDRETATEEEAEESGVEPALTAGAPRARAYQLLTVVMVAGVLAAIAVPTFLEQREEFARRAEKRLAFDVVNTVLVYDLTLLGKGAYPEAGVYNRKNPVGGSEELYYQPSPYVTITTTTSPNGYTVEGELTLLSGTFNQSLDSTTREYTPPLDRPRGGKRGGDQSSP